jgi:GNAT superfamily N-acetyltransferase
MTDDSTIELTFLADRADAIPVIAQWYFDQWGHLIKGETLERSLERLQNFLNRDKMPFILVAIRDGEIAGSAQLKFREMADLYPDKEHWLGGVYVAPGCRGQGLGSLLAEDIARRAPHYGVRTLHLQTERLDGGLYRHLGWVPLEQVNNHGLEVLVMERDLGSN